MTTKIPDAPEDERPEQWFEELLLNAVTSPGKDRLVGALNATVCTLRTALGCVTFNTDGDLEALREDLVNVLMRCADIVQACAVEANRRSQVTEDARRKERRAAHVVSLASLEDTITMPRSRGRPRKAKKVQP